jgi:hypothetical protein
VANPQYPVAIPRDKFADRRATPWRVAAYEDGWDCIRDSAGQILVKAATASRDQLYLMTEAPALLEALQSAVGKLERCAAAHGNDKESLDILLAPYKALIERIQQP